MAILEILEYPNPRLRDKAEPVTEVTDEIRRIIDDMFETLYADHGVGLAAIQVGIKQRIIVVDFSDDRSEAFVLINPEIIEHHGVMEHAEGCLSIPDCYENIKRHRHIVVRALDAQGETFELTLEGEDNQSSVCGCIQHEIDHLDGKLFIDYLSSIKRERIRKKLKKLQKVRM